MEINTANSILKVTSLLYFKEALYKGQFEICKELLGTARSYGALQQEIDEVIASYIRGDRPGGYEAFKGKNRLNLIKEKK